MHRTPLSDSVVLDQSDSKVSFEISECSTAAHAEFLGRSYFTGLDGIRCLAIVAVIWHHTPGRESLSVPILLRGYLGVDLFFVLSGFLITTILIREEKKTGTISLRNFYARRSLRIFPLYYGFLLALAIWSWFTDRAEFYEYSSILPYYLFYLTNFVDGGSRIFFEHGWSLAVEEQFYLLWPTMIKLLGMRRSGYVVSVIVLALAAVALIPQTLALHAYTGPFRTILIGSLLAILLNSASGFQLFHRAFGKRASVLWIAGVLILLILPPGDLVGWWQLLVHLVMAVVVGSIVVAPSNYLMPVLRLPAVKAIGVVSYGIYLIHSQLAGVVMAISARIPGGLSMELFFLAFLAVSATAACGTYYCFEIHFLKLKRYFVSKPPKASA